MTSEALRTALYDRHLKAKAKMVEFGGWMMPVQYSGILDEHRHVRSSCGLFDLSHMGEFELSGPSAASDLNRLLTNNVETAKAGWCIYSPMCNEAGGIVDDLVAYKLEDTAFMLVVNASNRAKDLTWVTSHLSAGTAVRDDSFETSLLALQGPLAVDVMSAQVPGIADLKTFRFRRCRLFGSDVVVSRTGYTGEDGFEIYCTNSAAPGLWDLFMADPRVKPIGLGARDTLRFEARLCLYGNDLDDSTSPLEAGLDWTVKFDKSEFVGKPVLERQRAEGPARKLVGFRMVGRGIARHGYEINDAGKPIGIVTSGTHSPSLEQNLGLGYVHRDHAAIGSLFSVRIRNQDVAAEVVATPFYQRPRPPKPS